MTEIADKHTITFGTDGIRGNAQQFPFTTDGLNTFGQALGLWAQKKYGTLNPKILIGADTRISSSRIFHDLCQALLAQGALVVDAGVIPTPAVYQLISSDPSFHAGIVISASHNPYQDNGIKVFDARRCKITREDELEIVRNFEQAFILPFNPLCPAEALAKAGWPNAHHAYQNTIKSHFSGLFFKNVKVVLDCANGATFTTAPDLFRALGADVNVLAASPNGTNINDQCGALHPERLSQAVLATQADCGFAFDGDGDRVVAVNRHGVVKDGDDILALLLQLPSYKPVSHVVGTIMTNQGFERYLNSLGKNLIRTNVGDKYVTAELEEKNLPLGGEASGHIIMKDYLDTGDGIFVALKVLESVITNNNWDMKTFDKYPQILINVPIEQKKDLTQSPFAQIITEHEKMLEHGRLIVRYSGTENLLRVMTEAATHGVASSIADAVAYKLQEALRTPLNPN